MNHILPARRATLSLSRACGSVALASTLVLSSCATTPAPKHEDTVAAALPSVTTPGTWTTTAPAGAVQDGWLKAFNDPQLNAIVEEALKNNLDLRGAKAKLDIAAASAQAAGASLKPVVSASGAGAVQGTSEGDRLNSRGAGLNASWELDVWGRLREQSSSAQLRYEGAELDYAFAKQSIAGATAKAWFIATETLQQQKLASDQVKTYQEMARLLEVRRAAGKSNEQDVRLAKADVASAQEREAAATTAHKQALRALEVLVGRYPSAELAAAPELPDVPAPVPAGVPSDVLERRPDVAAAERRVNAAFKNVQAKKLARLPQIALTAGVGANSDLSGITRQGGGFFNIGANFFAPIYDGGARKAEVKIATAEQEASLVTYGQTALRAFTDVENALDSDATLAQREALLETLVKENEEALRLRKIENTAGKADTLSVLQLQARVDAAKSGLITIRQARRSERVNLNLALGGGV